MKFKIGDKVRITPNAAWCGLVGETCVVSEVQNFNSKFACRVKHISSNWDCVMLEGEIEKLSTKGQQLLFSFMEK